VGFNGAIATRRLVERILQGLRQLEGFDAQFAEMLRDVQAESHGGLAARWGQVETGKKKLATEQANIMAAIAEYGPRPMFQQKLAELDTMERDLLLERSQLESLQSSRLGIPETVSEIRKKLEIEFGRLAIDSPEFGEFMKRLVPEFYVYLVCLCDGGHLLPRARVRLNLAGSIPGLEGVPALHDFFTRFWTVDLFEKPPQREIIRLDAVALQTKNPSMTHREIALQLPGNPTATAVGNALRLDRMMTALSLAEPYVMVMEPPENYTKLRRHRNSKYRFEPLPGYERPPI
jgi:hypothetical protein